MMPERKAVDTMSWAVVVNIKGRGYIAEWTIARTRAEAIDRYTKFFRKEDRAAFWRRERRAGKARCVLVIITEA